MLCGLSHRVNDTWHLFPPSSPNCVVEIPSYFTMHMKITACCTTHSASCIILRCIKQSLYMFIFKVNETANQILEAFIERLMDKDWLDEETKDRCVDKVSTLVYYMHAKVP